MPSAEPSSAETEASFTRAVEAARSGLRRDVQSLVDALDEGELLIPLAHDLPDAPEGQPVELSSELTLIPHLLPDLEGQLFCALFTTPEPLEPIVSALGWTTGGETLKVCAFPARIALQMAHDVVDETDVLGLVLDPGAPSELFLTRAELGSILNGRALPLVGYVANIPFDERERTLVADGAEPPPPELLSALAAWVAEQTGVKDHRLERTFNPDRDLEPHLTLSLSVEESADRAALFQSVTSALEGKLPPPGYLDVLFGP